MIAPQCSICLKDWRESCREHPVVFTPRMGNVRGLPTPHPDDPERDVWLTAAIARNPAKARALGLIP